MKRKKDNEGIEGKKNMSEEVRKSVRVETRGERMVGAAPAQAVKVHLPLFS